MENQNGTKKRRKWIIAGIVVVVVLFMMGCRTAAPRARYGRHQVLMGNNRVHLAAKDWEPVGVVFAETVAPRRSGFTATYNALMEEAGGKGADAIINVNVSPASGVFNITWSGSALAIRYLEAVP